MGYSVVLGGTLTLEGPHLIVNMNSEKRLNDRGDVEGVDWTVAIETDVVAATPALVAAGMVTLNNEVVQEHAAKGVEIKLDGTTIVNIQASTAFIGPFVTGFQTFSEDEGTGESHWRCAFTIFSRQIASESSYECSTSITVEKANGKIVRKTWTASCKSKTAAQALTHVMSFKPGEADIRERISRFFEEARAEAVWVWERRSEGSTLRHRCTVRYPEGGKDYVEDPVAGKGDGTGVPPNLYLARKTAMVIEVTGVIISTDPDVKEPAPHFTSSETMRRATKREVPTDVEIENEDRGEYKLTYHEVWLFTGTGKPPKPKHENNHHLIKVDSAPADGGAAS